MEIPVDVNLEHYSRVIGRPSIAGAVGWRCHNPFIQRRIDAQVQALRLITQSSVETG